MTRVTANDTARLVALIADARVHGRTDDRERLTAELAEASQRVGLTDRQVTALLALGTDEWEKVNGTTLEALVYKGLAEQSIRPRYRVGRLTDNGARRAATLRERSTT